MEKAKHQPGEPEKKKEQTAPVEFVAPYPLKDCVLRIRDTKSLDTAFMSPGFEPSYENVEPGVYRFRIRRTWYDRSHRQQGSMVELEGYLKGIDETSTVVIAKTHVSMSSLLMTGLLVAMMAIAAFIPPQKSGSIIFLIGGAVVLLAYWGLIWWDRRTLLHLIHRAMSDDLL
jgi:hypothetical protein